MSRLSILEDELRITQAAIAETTRLHEQSKTLTGDDYRINKKIYAAAAMFLSVELDDIQQKVDKARQAESTTGEQ